MDDDHLVFLPAIANTSTFALPWPLCPARIGDAFQISTTAQTVLGECDYLLRIQSGGGSGSSVNIGWTETATVVAMIGRDRQWQVDLLKSVIHWQHNLLDYNGHYNAYLLEQISEEEFSEVSEKYAYEPLSMAPEQLAPKIHAILSLTDINYTLADFADLFRCEPSDVLAAVGLLPDLPQLASKD